MYNIAWKIIWVVYAICRHNILLFRKLFVCVIFCDSFVCFIERVGKRNWMCKQFWSFPSCSHDNYNGLHKPRKNIRLVQMPSKWVGIYNAKFAWSLYNWRPITLVHSSRFYAIAVYADEIESTLIWFESKATIGKSCWLQSKPESGEQNCIYLRLVQTS